MAETTSASLDDDLAFERLKRTFECAPVGIAFVSPAGVLIDVNPAFCRMLGYPRAELCGRTFHEVTHPEDVAPNVELLERLGSGDIDGYRMQKRYLRASGEVLWADLTVSVLRDPADRVLSYISIIVDIGEAKQLEGRLSFLLHELQHRSKNLLAVVRATTHRIAATATSVKSMLAGVDDRLMGLAASQDLLVTMGQGVALAELVEKQISAFVPANDARVVIDGPRVALGPNATNTIGMALHELATNACKYGALSVIEGVIQISWTLADGELLLTWQERGGPPVSPPDHKGFGRNVIERSAENLGGETTLTFDPAGVCWRLRAPQAGLAH
ncbi:PAS domain S-box protein [Phenylobacterium sp. LjRoot219]|uniref:sensor histidine kinase n=1 Tax=Phenylobacterium sp. LjRoot219 TaxID=3342283 RepID=UPI003ED09717